MDIEEAINIVDTMYQERMKTIEINENTIDVGKFQEVHFSELETASVRLLREVMKLTRKLENSIPQQQIQDKIDEIKENIEEYKKWKIKGIETDVDYYDNIADVRTVQVLEELLKGDNNEQI